MSVFLFGDVGSVRGLRHWARRHRSALKIAACVALATAYFVAAYIIKCSILVRTLATAPSEVCHGYDESCWAEAPGVVLVGQESW